MSCGVPYIIGKFLERRCLKWVRIAHSDIWNTSYGQKKSWESNCQFDSWPQKVENRFDLLSFRGRVTYRWKALDERYNFALDYISIGGLLAKLWGSKVTRVPAGGISGLPLGSPGKNSHLDVASVESCRVYYRGGRWWLPPNPGRGESCVSVLPVARPSTKGALIMHYPLCVGCVQAHVSELSLSTLPSPIPELRHAPLPLKVLWAREHAPTPPSSAVLYLGSHLSHLRSWECVTFARILKFYTKYII
jgi:hypothetical protein